MGEGRREREKERIPSRLRCGAQIHELGDYDLSQNQELDAGHLGGSVG